MRDRLQRLAFVCLFLALASLAACDPVRPVSYDPLTEAHLAELKRQVLDLYDTFARDPIDTKASDAVRQKLVDLHAGEKAKGDNNRETARQVQIIQNMFDRHVKDRSEHGVWNESHLLMLKQDISEAFDIAIATEKLKNKKE